MFFKGRKMEKMTFQGYNIYYTKGMLMTQNDALKIVVSIHRSDKTVHCLLDFSSGGLMIEAGWSCDYKIEGQDVYLISYDNAYSLD